MNYMRAWLLFVFGTVVTVVLLFATMSWGAFPNDHYDHIQKSSAICTIAANCGCLTDECVCENNVCKYADNKMDPVAQYVEDIGRELRVDNPATNMTGVIEPTEIANSSVFKVWLTDETGSASSTSRLVYSDSPTINSPIIPSVVAGGLPGAGTPDRLFIVRSAATCTTAGTLTLLCRDTGSAFEVVGALAAAGDVTGVGNCTTGDCFTGPSGTGTQLVFRGTSSGTITITAGSNVGSNTLTLPSATGTICTSAQVCSGYAASGHTHSTIGDNILVNGTHLTDANFTAAGDISFSRVVGPPDQILANYNANSVILGADTTGTLPGTEGGTGMDLTAAGMDRGGLIAGTATAGQVGVFNAGVEGQILSVDLGENRGLRWIDLPPQCVLVQDLTTSSARLMVGMHRTVMSVSRISCHCRGSCTTPATVQFQDSASSPNVVGSLTCSANNTIPANSVDVTGGANSLFSAFERVEVTVTAGPSPTTDEYLFCFWATH
jgi:hypothetical protein